MASIGSPRADLVGEIDTRPPFQSVKAALNLFVEASGSNKQLSTRPSFKKKLAENGMDKETQYLLTQRELNNIKQRLESAEAVKHRAIPELERAKRTLQDLTSKLNAVAESKKSSVSAAEAVRERAKKLEVEAGTETWKRDLEMTRSDYAAASSELNASKKELNEIRRGFDLALEAKLAAFHAAGEAHRSARAGAEKARELSGEISAVKASAADHAAAAERARRENLRAVNLEIEAVRELIEAAKRLREVEEEKRLMKSLVGDLEAELCRRRESDDQKLFAVQKLVESAEGARRERDEVANCAERVKQEIEDSRVKLEEVERRLKEAEAEAEEAKGLERRAVSEMKLMSLAGDVRLSAEDFEAFNGKVDAVKSSAETIVSESVATVFVIESRKAEAEKKLEANLKAIEEIKAATDLALRTAEMSDSAKTVVENELRKWRHEERISGQLKS